MDKQKENGFLSFFKKIGASFRRKGFRSGVYATVTSALVIVAVIIVNLIASASGFQKDLTTTGDKSLTEETRELVEGLEDDLTFYFLTKEGQNLSWLEPYYQMYIELYERAGDNITFETVDLLLNPKFAEEYTSESVAQYSMIVVNETTGLSKYISVTDMVLTEMTLDQTTFQYKEVPIGIDIEGQLNAAIRYVTDGQQTNLYAVSGHGELELGTEGKNLLRKANINYHLLESMTVTSVPEDCDILYVAAPTKDYTDEELAMFKAYADNGGDFLVHAVKQSEMSNYESLLSYCGVRVDSKIVLEGDSSYHNPASQLELFPVIEKNHEITEKLTGTSYLPMQYALPLSRVMDADSEFTMSVLLSTSNASYAKSVENGSVKLTKVDGDPEGPFYIGMYLKNEATKSEAVVLSSSYVFVDTYLKLSNYANAGLLTNSINYMTEKDAVSTVRTISFDSQEVLTITAAQANAIAIVLVAVIPAALIIAGIVMMLRRRSR